MKIGSLLIEPPTFLAPMAAVSDLPYRRLCREYQVGMVTTELISIQGLTLGRGKVLEKTRELLRSHPAERPRSVQLFGGDPALVADAAQLAVEEGADIIDFNMGCPVAKVCKLGAGAALLKDPMHAAKLVAAAVRAVSVPVTAKIRSGWEAREGIDVACRLVDAGASAIAVHARTRTQKFSGRADWSMIREIKAALSVPVIGNGDVFSPEDAVRMRDETGCDGVMVGRAAMGMPMIFREIAAALAGKPYQWPPQRDERLSAFLRHMELCEETFGEKMPLELRNQILSYARSQKAQQALRAMLPQLVTVEDYRTAGRILFSLEEDLGTLAKLQQEGYG